MNNIRYYIPLFIICIFSCKKDKPIDNSVDITENYPSGWQTFKTDYTASFSGMALNHLDDVWIWSNDVNHRLYKMTEAVFTDHSKAINRYLGFNSRITSLAADKDNQEWIAVNNLDNDTSSAALIQYDGTNCKTYKSSNSGIHSAHVMDVAIDSKDQKWLGTTSGLIKYDGTTWIHYDSLNSSVREYYPLISAFGAVWITGRRSLKKTDGTSFVNWDASNSSFPPSGMRVADNDGLGNLWFMGYSDTMNLWKFNGSAFSSFAIPLQYKPVLNSVFAVVKVDLSNNVWVAGNGRLLKFNGSNWTSYPVPSYTVSGGDPRLPHPNGPVQANFLDMIVRGDSTKLFLEEKFSGKNIMSFQE